MSFEGRFRIVQALSVTSAVLAACLLVPSGAHVLEMPAKLSLSRDSYFIVQRIYNGWALFGVAIVAEILIAIALGLAARPLSFEITVSAFAAAGLIALGLAVFLLRVQPANAVTGNWLRPTQDRERLRGSWEWGHLTIAVLTTAAFGTSIFGLMHSAALVARDANSSRD